MGFLLPGKSPPDSLLFTGAEPYLSTAEPKPTLQLPTLTASPPSRIPAPTAALPSSLSLVSLDARFSSVALLNEL